MTLTVVLGSSGSGKTTLLNDCFKQHKCIYIRQFHAARPYIPVTSIPDFDPTQLPFWDIYVKEGTADKIKIGGTMAGEFHAGLSGGQRKMLFFELIRQRISKQKDLLVVLDEPFAGVTDDFVPFIEERLKEMRIIHNILLVTNDHVQVLKDIADNTVVVSAVNRDEVHVNGRKADREKVILALSIGDPYRYNAGWADIAFFLQVEVFANPGLLTISAFSIVLYGLFLLTFWDSSPESVALVLVAGDIVSYFSVNPYLLAGVEWRNSMIEESEALLHSSVATNRFLRTCLSLFLIIIVATMEFGIVNAVIDGLDDVQFWVAILFDSASTTLPFICAGIYTSLPFQDAEVLGSFPFLLMLFFSTAFSPGSGVKGVKEVRYLFPRFYFWCLIDELEPSMEGCPEDYTLLYLVLSAFVYVFVFVSIKMIMHALSTMSAEKKLADQKASLMDDEFAELQKEMFDSNMRQSLLKQETFGIVEVLEV